MVLVLVLLAASLALHRPPFESLLFAVALAVGLTPEFLPMITTVTLSKGASRMAAEHVIVKHLSAIQNLGSMDTLCTDKTGTLTRGEMRLEGSYGVDGKPSPRALALARLNSRMQTGIRSPLDTAILAATDDGTSSALPRRGQHEEDAAADAEWHKLDEIPFDFERRRLSIVAERGGERLLVTKGAADGICALCGASGEERGRWDSLVASLGAKGMRLLAVASRKVDVEVKVVTGDDPVVARHIVESVGLDPGEVVSGADIDRMTDGALARIAEKTTVFARTSPAQKTRILLALKHAGRVVGFMGDGINDAPSLHAADVGIAAPHAVDVAREAGDILLTEPGLGVLHRGILEGRRAFANVTKYLLMGTSSNFGNMLSMAVASLVLPFLPMLPTQILLNNLLYDVSQLTIPTDQVDESWLRTPHRSDMPLIRRFMILIGPISSAFDFLTFFVLLRVFHASQELFHTGWFVESLCTQTLVLFVIRTYERPWKSRPSAALAASVLLTAAFGAILPGIAPLARLLGFVPLPPVFYGFVALATVAYLGLVELAKHALVKDKALAQY
jgi:Mg2+-importing ATPase